MSKVLYVATQQIVVIAEVGGLGLVETDSTPERSAPGGPDTQNTTLGKSNSMSV